MIKVVNNNFKIGMQFKLRNAWRDKIIDTTGIKDFPFTFEIINVSEDNYVCQSVSDKKSDKIRNLLVKKEILSYLTGVEVDTVNVGLYFCDYIPASCPKSTMLMVFLLIFLVLSVMTAICK